MQVSEPLRRGGRTRNFPERYSESGFATREQVESEEPPACWSTETWARHWEKRTAFGNKDNKLVFLGKSNIAGDAKQEGHEPGNGLFAKQDLKPSQMISFYMFQSVNEQEEAEQDTEKDSQYKLGDGVGEWDWGKSSWGVAQFANHRPADECNAILVKVDRLKGTDTQYALVSLRKILAAEEITFYYGSSYWN